ncbi:hypothetical protein K457DRAFT_129877 [Linnemannia elongata AG-77]|uniref:Uncharacterized protein n=1 Tax=Linnemannia elongata AG-77 TaxID=1314771 RepID=A0A197JJ10_9FUNG|nr:hypothetical protein K457DRAFT_129877 [Linnemannia elongata AG-77]
MLGECPSLEVLKLNMQAFNGSDYPIRPISMDDLFLPGTVAYTTTESDDNLAKWDGGERVRGSPMVNRAIVAPAVKDLYLVGYWEIGDSLLQQLLVVTFPSLEKLNLEGVMGCTIEKMVDLLNHLRRAQIGRTIPI